MWIKVGKYHINTDKVTHTWTNDAGTLYVMFPAPAGDEQSFAQFDGERAKAIRKMFDKMSAVTIS